MNTLRVAVDVGSRFHQVAIGDGSGQLLDEFQIDHGRAGFEQSFARTCGEKTVSGTISKYGAEWGGLHFRKKVSGRIVPGFASCVARHRRDRQQMPIVSGIVSRGTVDHRLPLAMSL